MKQSLLMAADTDLGLQQTLCNTLNSLPQDIKLLCCQYWYHSIGSVPGPGAQCSFAAPVSETPHTECPQNAVAWPKQANIFLLQNNCWSCVQVL